MTRDELSARGWREIDVLLVTGDAYFDHPSHGAAVIGRILEAAGYRVGLVAQPDWRSTGDFERLGRPLLFAGVTAGAVDSMVNNWTAQGKRRRRDVYAPGGQGGARPDHATVVYTNRVRQAFPGLPVVLGGIEASLRRFAYYDPIKHQLRRSVLVDSRADILVYGSGENQVLAIAGRLGRGESLEGIPGTARLIRGKAEDLRGGRALPEFEALRVEPRRLIDQMRLLDEGGCPRTNPGIYQRYTEGTIWQEPRPGLGSDQLDQLSALPFTRDAHPLYREPIPALEPIRWSIISHRGCPGGCSFCGLTMHQGRRVISRTADSILEELNQLLAHSMFRGVISDLGGPTANAYGTTTDDPGACERCQRASCLHPKRCRHLVVDHRPLSRLLDTMATTAGVKQVLLASGIRHDLALDDPAFIAQLAVAHAGGHLKAAPEHVTPSVLRRMRKPSIEQFEQFENLFRRASRQANKQQYIVPYFIAGFPGCTPSDADRLGRWLASRGQRLQQVQTFMPLPGTMAAAMQAAGHDERGRPLFLADAAECRRQKSLLVDLKARPQHRRNRR